MDQAKVESRSRSNDVGMVTSLHGLIRILSLGRSNSSFTQIVGRLSDAICMCWFCHRNNLPYRRPTKKVILTCWPGPSRQLHQQRGHSAGCHRGGENPAQNPTEKKTKTKQDVESAKARRFELFSPNERSSRSAPQQTKHGEIIVQRHYRQPQAIGRSRNTNLYVRDSAAVARVVEKGGHARAWWVRRYHHHLRRIRIEAECWQTRARVILFVLCVIHHLHPLLTHRRADERRIKETLNIHKTSIGT